jgi:hypothetical protein
MKSLNIRKSILIGALAFGTLGLLAPTLSLADGKGASKLLPEPSASKVQTPAPATAQTHMACCTDHYVKVADTSAKGMNAGATKTVPAHPCPYCQTKIASVGAGKAKTDKVTHSCGSSASTTASCCVAAR